MADTGGFMFTSLDAVDLRAYLGVTTTAWVKVAQTTWESNDFVRIWYEYADSCALCLVLRMADSRHESCQGE